MLPVYEVGGSLMEIVVQMWYRRYDGSSRDSRTSVDGARFVQVKNDLRFRGQKEVGEMDGDGDGAV